MSFEVSCQSCGQVLRLSDQDAGKKARCPKCKHVFTVPDRGNPALSEFDAAGSEDSPRTEPLWHVRIQDGRQYGPINKRELDSWVAEGRVTRDCKVRRDGDVTWLAASAVYPVLTKGAAPFTGQNPFTEQSSQADSNPYASPSYTPADSFGDSTWRRSRYQKPHRGGTILALGIAGIFCCAFLGIAAWIMAINDLREMSNGRMDPRGRGLTIAGMIVGIIATIMYGVSFLAQMAEIR